MLTGKSVRTRLPGVPRAPRCKGQSLREIRRCAPETCLIRYSNTATARRKGLPFQSGRPKITPCGDHIKEDGFAVLFSRTENFSSQPRAAMV